MDAYTLAIIFYVGIVSMAATVVVLTLMYFSKPRSSKTTSVSLSPASPEREVKSRGGQGSNQIQKRRRKLMPKGTIHRPSQKWSKPRPRSTIPLPSKNQRRVRPSVTCNRSQTGSLKVRSRR